MMQCVVFDGNLLDEIVLDGNWLDELYLDGNLLDEVVLDGKLLDELPMISNLCVKYVRMMYLVLNKEGWCIYRSAQK